MSVVITLDHASTGSTKSPINFIVRINSYYPSHLLNTISFLLRRDPYIFNLFEVLLTTLESKLRRVENMDRALERLVRRLDTVENRLAVNLNTTAQVSRPHIHQLSSYKCPH